MNTSDIGFKLKKSCDDCPFKRTTPLHTGVMRDLPMYEENLRDGRFAHTCHKTDSRADGYVDQYNGQVQHCFGALAMFINMEKSAGEEDVTPDGFPATQTVLYYALAKGNNEYEDMVDPDAFASFGEMAKAYKPMIEELAAEQIRDDGLRIHITRTNKYGKRERITL